MCGYVLDSLGLPSSVSVSELLSTQTPTLSRRRYDVVLVLPDFTCVPVRRSLHATHSPRCSLHADRRLFADGPILSRMSYLRELTVGVLKGRQ